MSSPIRFVAVATAFVAALVAVMLAFDIDQQVIALLRWIDQQGPVARLWFVGLMMLAVVLLLPGLLLTTGAGFVFGILEGTVYVVAGTTAGACVAFLAARHLAGGRVLRFLNRRRNLRALRQGLGYADARTVLLTRLVPFFPGKLSNYLFGLSGVSLRGFTAATAVGLVPFSLHNVYLGSLASSLLTLDQAATGRSPLEWSVYVLGFLATVTAVVYFNRMAQRALADAAAPSAAEVQQ
ncbi:MAG: VTT domain-containing protein [Halieaceae bacterium]|jgi:uncharacterized membrane protein YdjX (TVP38/TMEM64 family)|nr:VTT domain-containing protein [Halieaceae bacterium]